MILLRQWRCTGTATLSVWVRCFSTQVPKLNNQPKPHADVTADASVPYVRTRFAPSPTGNLHIGGLRTALYNYLIVKQHQQRQRHTRGDGESTHLPSAFILRIEDTDQKRLQHDSMENIFRTLHWAGLDYDEGPPSVITQNQERGNHGPYIQSHRLPLYSQYAKQLVEMGHAYPCFCTPQRLEELRQSQQQKGLPTAYDRHCSHRTIKENIQLIADADANADDNSAAARPYTIRMKVPESGVITVYDTVRGEVDFLASAIDDCVLLKSDKFPTYHLAVVVDDHLMKITHVIRGDEWFTSFPKHVLLYNMFNWHNSMPSFTHLPLLLKSDGTKLSKRTNDASAEFYQQSGYSADALLNFIALCGWSLPNVAPSNPEPRNPTDGPKDSTSLSSSEVLTRAQLIQYFSLNRLQKSGAMLNISKLIHFNAAHLRLKIENEPAELIGLILQELTKLHPNFDFQAESNQQYLRNVIDALKSKVSFLNQLVEFSHPFFTDPVLSDLSTQATGTGVKSIPQSANGDLATSKISPKLKFIEKAISNSSESVDRLEKFLLLLNGTPASIFDDLNELKKRLQQFCDSQNIQPQKFYILLRYILSETENGPGIFTIIQLLGKDVVVRRCMYALNRLSNSTK